MLQLAAYILSIAAIGNALAAGRPPDSSPSTAPTTAPAGPSSQSTTTRIPLRIAGRAESGEYWLRTPPGYTPDQCPALLIALHGTDDTARQMIDFWGALRTSVPILLAAPQGLGQGWSETDLPVVRAMWTDLRGRFGFDEERVLLAGFSAGGSMTFELLYEQKLPVTAAAALASYVPPRIAAAAVAARRQVPVFYAVGMADLNHERMRVGLDYLRSAGANVEIYRPRIGHTLDAQVAQKAVDWFFEHARKRLDAAIEQATKDDDLVRAVARLEAITTQARWHEPAIVQKAAEVLTQREEQGRNDLRMADGLVTAGRQVEAAELLRKIQNAYGRGRLGRAVRTRREKLEADPAVRDELVRREANRRTEQAADLYAAAQRLVAQDRRTEAADYCRQVISQYADTPTAERARRLLDMLEIRSAP